MENQPLHLVPRHPDDPQVRVDTSSGSFSINTPQLVDHKALTRKTTATNNSALSIIEYVYNQPEISEESNAGLHHLKLDLVSAFNFAWMTVHYNMLMQCSISFGYNLSRNIPLIYDDEKVALLHTPFKGTTLFGGELTKLQEPNTECASALTVFPAPAAPSHTYTTKPYTGHGKLFRKGGDSHKIGGRNRDHGRSASATITKQ